uniref:Uncharacterized protein n=1 Tax=Tetranychus urticae TaxID=32264 RepID=T1KV00_TETUR
MWFHRHQACLCVPTLHLPIILPVNITSRFAKYSNMDVKEQTDGNG